MVMVESFCNVSSFSLCSGNVLVFWRHGHASHLLFSWRCWWFCYWDPDVFEWLIYKVDRS